MKPWSREVAPRRGEVVPVTAELEPEKPLKPEPPPRNEPPPAPKVDADSAADYPVASVRVLAKKHALVVPSASGNVPFG